MEIMPRTVLKIFIAFYTMAATLSLVNAAPTTIASAPAATTTAPTGMAGNPAVLTFNQSQCPTSGSDSSDSVAEANNSLCHGQFISKGVIEDILGVSK